MEWWMNCQTVQNHFDWWFVHVQYASVYHSCHPGNGYTLLIFRGWHCRQWHGYTSGIRFYSAPPPVNRNAMYCAVKNRTSLCGRHMVVTGRRHGCRVHHPHILLRHAQIAYLFYTGLWVNNNPGFLCYHWTAQTGGRLIYFPAAGYLWYGYLLHSARIR